MCGQHAYPEKSKKGCPNVEGKWYSDSYVRQADGCNVMFKDYYNPAVLLMNIGAGSKILLAKYEVCNDPGCFDPAYEKAKQQRALPCEKGKCA